MLHPAQLILRNSSEADPLTVIVSINETFTSSPLIPVLPRSLPSQIGSSVTLRCVGGRFCDTDRHQRQLNRELGGPACACCGQQNSTVVAINQYNSHKMRDRHTDRVDDMQQDWQVWVTRAPETEVRIKIESAGCVRGRWHSGVGGS